MPRQLVHLTQPRSISNCFLDPQHLKHTDGSRSMYPLPQHLLQMAFSMRESKSILNPEHLGHFRNIIFSESPGIRSTGSAVTVTRGCISLLMVRFPRYINTHIRFVFFHSNPRNWCYPQTHHYGAVAVGSFPWQLFRPGLNTTHFLYVDHSIKSYQITSIPYQICRIDQAVTALTQFFLLIQ